MRLTTWAEYGMIVTLNLARRPNDGTVAARAVAVQERLPADYVEQILLRLRRAGLVESTRGARGGYRLAREASSISVRDVVCAVEGCTFEAACERRPIDAERCGPGVPCSMRPLWRAVQRRVDDVLESVSVDDLLHPEAEVEQLLSAPAGH